MENKTLLDFADFVKQIEFDEYGNPTNLQYNTQYGCPVWVNIEYFEYVTYLNYVNDKIRIKKQPKMRAMDFRDADKLIGQVATYCNNDITLYYVVIDACFNDKISAGGTTYTYDEFYEHYTRPDGSKFEVEDV